MKFKVFIMYVLVVLLTACANTHIPRAKVTFKVVNQDGKPIVSEPVKVGFSQTDVSRGKTNPKGFFTAEGRTADDYLFVIGRLKVDEDSPKYYRKSFRKYVAHWKTRPTDDKWKPWNETIEIVVKEKKKPIQMYAVDCIHARLKVPQQDQWCGFDFETHDWLPPYGCGKIADVEVYFKSEQYESDWKQTFLKIRFPSPLAGAYLASKDENSALMSVHNADERSSYTPLFSFHSEIMKNAEAFFPLIKKGSEKNMITKDQYLIFRTRTKVDKDGRLIEARYGKIYGPISFYSLTSQNKAMIELVYYLNPNINDTNLECNGKSLIKGVNSVLP